MRNPRNDPGHTRNPEDGIPPPRLRPLAGHRQAPAISLPRMRNRGRDGLSPARLPIAGPPAPGTPCQSSPASTGQPGPAARQRPQPAAHPAAQAPAPATHTAQPGNAPRTAKQAHPPCLQAGVLVVETRITGFATAAPTSAIVRSLPGNRYPPGQPHTVRSRPRPPASRKSRLPRRPHRHQRSTPTGGAARRTPGIRSVDPWPLAPARAERADLGGQRLDRAGADVRAERRLLALGIGLTKSLTVIWPRAGSAWRRAGLPGVGSWSSRPARLAARALS
jgi:hypothetical protein